MTTPALEPTRRAAPLVFDVEAFRDHAVRTGVLAEHDWRIAQEVARQQGASPLRALLDLGAVAEPALADALSSLLEIKRWSPDTEQAPLSPSVSHAFMSTSGLLVLDNDLDREEAEAPPASVRLIVSDPGDRRSWQAVAARYADAIAGVEIATHKDIAAFLDRQLEQVERGADRDTEQIDVSGEISALRDMASEAPVVRFFNQTVERAMELGASDIHIERFDHRAALRLRVDGMLAESPPPPSRMFEPLLCRIKILSNLDIAERRKAQDGRIRMRLRGRQVDMRVSLVPTMYGQDAVIRLQDRAKLEEVDLRALGFFPEQIEELMGIASLAHGILLVTGPTGSGKTTTLYAILQRILGVERKIVTVEDPVEFAMDGVNQIQVNPGVGMSFSNTLRHVLRHDPDVVLVGEIRDAETAQIAFQASLTGHMVLSTLHTNDVPGSFVRLIDMGIEPFLVSAAVEGIAAQRLLRKVCAACRNEPSKRETCDHCAGFGYKGRIAILELARTSTRVKKQLAKSADEHALRQALLEDGYSDLGAQARRLLDEGVTDEAEVVRVLGRAQPDSRGGAR
jgi:general secretion pathway protein E